MKNITVRVIGGLGNQLHCYAFGRALALQNEAILTLDVESGYWKDPYKREYLLDQFPSLVVRKKSYPTTNVFGRILFKIILKLKIVISKALPISLKPIIQESVPRHYQIEIHRTKFISNPYFLGYWASYRYYQDISDELRWELQPPKPHDAEALHILANIESETSCSIHWRFYFEEKGVHHPLMNNYYKKAVKLMEASLPGIKFFVFSDEIMTAQKECNELGLKATFVDLPAAKGNIQCLTDFFLMYSCNHAIIGDSSFSWWAAWLGNPKGKSVIAPKGLSPWGDDWLPPYWTAIDIN